MKPLQILAESQGRWSKTADRLKSDYQNARRLVLWLSVTGALLAAIAGQRDGFDRHLLAGLSATAFAVVSLVAARRLGPDRAMAWVRARAAAEALKREAYTFAARAAPYDDPVTGLEALKRATGMIESAVTDLYVEQGAAPAGRTPVDFLEPEQYLDQRIRGQITNFFEDKASRYLTYSNRWRRMELILAVLTACVTAGFGAFDKLKAPGSSFDIVALASVITVLSGAITAHIEGSRYDFMVASYRATAQRLRSILAYAPAVLVAPSPEWSALVNELETVLSEENHSWAAKLGTPAPVPAAATEKRERS